MGAWVRVLVTILLTAGSASFAFPSVHRVNLVDLSEKGSPITFSGTALLSDSNSTKAHSSYRAHITATNTSQQAVVLLVFVTTMAGPAGEQTIHRGQEYFFTGSVFRPSTSETFDLSLPASGDATPGKPAAEVTLEFVQYLDGSTWGDADAARIDLALSRQTLDELRKLDQTYEDSGEWAFTSELLSAKQLILPSINLLVGMYENQGKDPAAIRQAVREMIAAANSHERSAERQLSRSQP